MFENKILAKQEEALKKMLEADRDLYEIIEKVSALNISNLYVGGGCITQTVWNQIFSKPIGYGISDVDIVYFDPDLSLEKEEKTIQKIKGAIKNKPYSIDVKNEARVHLWYEEKFGFSISPYSSTEEAISTWPSTATSIGVYIDSEENLQIFAPYGLNDLFSGILKPNKVLISKEIYDKKVEKWVSKWSELRVEKF